MCLKSPRFGQTVSDTWNWYSCSLCWQIDRKLPGGLLVGIGVRTKLSLHGIRQSYKQSVSIWWQSHTDINGSYHRICFESSPSIPSAPSPPQISTSFSTQVKCRSNSLLWSSELVQFRHCNVTILAINGPPKNSMTDLYRGKIHDGRNDCVSQNFRLSQAFTDEFHQLSLMVEYRSGSFRQPYTHSMRRGNVECGVHKYLIGHCVRPVDERVEAPPWEALYICAKK